jgi:hypothetical protein
MAKVLEATCEAGVVRYQGRVVSAEILSEGVESSEGILILDRENAYYVAKTSPDLKMIITDLKAILDQIVSVLGPIDGAAGSGQAGGISGIASAASAFDAKKESLR